MGMMSKVWGPPAWLFLHCVTLCYDPCRKKQYKMFFNCLKDVLPCGKCRENYTKIIKDGDLKLTDKHFVSKEVLSDWLYKVHYKVQNDIYKCTTLKKDKPKKKTTTFWNNFYEKFRAKCGSLSGCDKASVGRRKMSTIYITNYHCRMAQKSLLLM